MFRKAFFKNMLVYYKAILVDAFVCGDWFDVILARSSSHSCCDLCYLAFARVEPQVDIPARPRSRGVMTVIVSTIRGHIATSVGAGAKASR